MLWRCAPGATPFLDEEALAALAGLPCRRVLHGVGYPVGGTRAPDRAALALLRRTIDALAPAWVSEHLSFNHTGDGVAGFMLPPRQNRAGAIAAADSIRAMADALGMPIAVETGVNYWPPRDDEWPDGAWVAEVAERADCGLLLDLHNAWTNQRNGRQTVRDFVDQLPYGRIWEVHLAGGEERHGLWIDGHCAGLPDELEAIARDIVPTLPNLRALVFETFPAYLAGFGPRFLPEQVARLRALAAIPRREVRPAGGPTAPADVGPTPEEWERALGRLVVGFSPSGPLEEELAAHPALGLIGELVAEARASSIVAALPLSSFLIMKYLGPARLQALVADFGAQTLPERFASAEAIRFAGWLRLPDVPYLAEVLAYERAVVEVLCGGPGRVVPFGHDPLPLLRALARREIPREVRAGRFEVEVTGGAP